MKALLIVVGYILVVLFGTEFFYIMTGSSLAYRVFDHTLWHMFCAGSMLIMGIWLTTGKQEIDTGPETGSGVLGMLSLVFGAAGILWWPAILGIPAVVLAVLQIRKYAGRIAVAGLCLGVIDFILAAIWYGPGLLSAVFQ